MVTRAAKNGNGAAQGTLSDLYKQGLGVSQSFVLAYVWQNLAVVSQSRYNQAMTSTHTGNELLGSNKEVRDGLYNSLTSAQKDQAQELINEFEKVYLKSPSEEEQMCSFVIRTLAGNNVFKMIKVIASKLPKK